jgi:hypothetical protein
MGVGRQRHAPAVLTPGKRTGTHFTGGWVGARAGLDGRGKSHPHRESIPGSPRPQRVLPVRSEKNKLEISRLREETFCPERQLTLFTV